MRQVKAKRNKYAGKKFSDEMNKHNENPGSECACVQCGCYISHSWQEEATLHFID